VPRVKRGTKRRANRKKDPGARPRIFLTKSKLYRAAQEAVERSLRHGYIGRKHKKREFRSLVDRPHQCGLPDGGLSYSKFMDGLKEVRRRSESQGSWRRSPPPTKRASARWWSGSKRRTPAPGSVVQVQVVNKHGSNATTTLIDQTPMRSRAWRSAFCALWISFRNLRKPERCAASGGRTEG
jgi:ribosomal protein L20